MSPFERPFQVPQWKGNWGLQTTAALVAVLILGFSLRLYGITSESIWLDEAFSIQLAKYDPVEIIRKTARDVHPPLYYLLLHFWINLFGFFRFFSASAPSSCCTGSAHIYSIERRALLAP